MARETGFEPRMSRALVEHQLSLNAADIPHLNGEHAFGATIRWGAGPRGDPIRAGESDSESAIV